MYQDKYVHITKWCLITNKSCNNFKCLDGPHLFIVLADSDSISSFQIEEKDPASMIQISYWEIHLFSTSCPDNFPPEVFKWKLGSHGDLLPLVNLSFFLKLILRIPLGIMEIEKTITVCTTGLQIYNRSLWFELGPQMSTPPRQGFELMIMVKYKIERLPTTQPIVLI